MNRWGRRSEIHVPELCEQDYLGIQCREERAFTMNPLLERLNQFHQFALDRINSSNETVTLDQLYDEWRLFNPDHHEVDGDAVAIADSLSDYRAGAQGIAADELIRKLKSRHLNG